MSDLTKQLEQALKPMTPLNAALLKCVEALDEITEVVGTSTLQHKIASKAIADLRKALGGMQARNGKVERLWIQNESGLVGVFNVRKLVLNYRPEGYDEKTPLGPRYIEVISIEDHDRVVAELRAEVERPMVRGE